MINECAKFHKDSLCGKRIKSISGARSDFWRRPILCGTFYRNLMQASNFGATIDQLTFQFFMCFSQKRRSLSTFSIPLCKKVKMTKNSIKGPGVLRQNCQFDILAIDQNVGPHKLQDSWEHLRAPLNGRLQLLLARSRVPAVNHDSHWHWRRDHFVFCRGREAVRTMHWPRPLTFVCCTNVLMVRGNHCQKKNSLTIHCWWVSFFAKWLSFSKAQWNDLSKQRASGKEKRSSSTSANESGNFSVNFRSTLLPQ